MPSVRQVVFTAVYILQVVGSLFFIYWLSTGGWNRLSPSTSALFLVAEVIAFFSSTLFLFNGIFSSTARNEESLDLIKKGNNLEKSKPVVAVCVCRYKEPLVDLLLTLHTMLEVEWPDALLQLYILDDGWYAQTNEFRKNQATQLKDLVDESEPLLADGLPRMQSCGDPHRPDCATESTFWQIREAKPGRCSVTLVARHKPKNTHFKAGNLNNFLYNHLGYLADDGVTVPQYMLILDHDMLPAKTILAHSIPRMQEDDGLAFIQFPQRFYDIGKKDVLYAGNEIFFDGVQINRGEIGLAAFAGTNAVWSLGCLYNVGGLQYGSICEDAHTGMAAHISGYTSRYSTLPLAVGQSPQTVPDAMQQRMRWSRGSVEMLMLKCRGKKKVAIPTPGEIRNQFRKHKTPAPPSFVKKLIMGIMYLDSMVYPIYSLGFPLHIAVCISYLFNNEAPVAPEDPIQILYYWLPLYALKACVQIMSFPDVRLACHWNSQMAWAGYSWPQLASIKDAMGFQVEWFNTGAGSKKRFLLQYTNPAMAGLVYLLILFRAFAFVFLDQGCEAWRTLGACMYGFVMLLHLKDWAMEPIKAALEARNQDQDQPSNEKAIPDDCTVKITADEAEPSVRVDRPEGYYDPEFAFSRPRRGSEASFKTTSSVCESLTADLLIMRNGSGKFTPTGSGKFTPTGSAQFVVPRDGGAKPFTFPNSGGSTPQAAVSTPKASREHCRTPTGSFLVRKRVSGLSRSSSEGFPGTGPGPLEREISRSSEEGAHSELSAQGSPVFGPAAPAPAGLEEVAGDPIFSRRPPPLEERDLKVLPPAGGVESFRSARGFTLTPESSTHSFSRRGSPLESPAEESPGPSVTPRTVGWGSMSAFQIPAAGKREAEAIQVSNGAAIQVSNSPPSSLMGSTKSLLGSTKNLLGSSKSLMRTVSVSGSQRDMGEDRAQRLGVEAVRRTRLLKQVNETEEGKLKKAVPDSHVQALVLSREAFHKHAMDLSIPFIISIVLVMSCLLGFWSMSNCDGGDVLNQLTTIQQDASDLECAARATPRLPPLPADVRAEAIFSSDPSDPSFRRSDTSGRQLSLNGHPFIVKGANWFGFETTRNMAFGLDVAAQDEVLSSLVEHGVNTIRLPLAAKSILNSSDFNAPAWSVDAELNPHMELDDYLDGVEAFVSRAAQWGVFTLLDMHLLRNDKYPDPLPFDDEVPLRDVALAWERLAERFCGHWAVMGADLKNEPFDATWGDGSETDWQVAAEMLGETVAEACPHWLIFVEGIFKYDSEANPGPLNQNASLAWASSLQPVAEHPISLPDMSKLVYSPHLYGPGTLGPNYMWESQVDGCMICNYCRETPPGLNCGDCTTHVPGLLDAITEGCRGMLPLSDSPYPNNMPHIWDYKFGFLESDYTVVVGEWGGTYANPALTHLPKFDKLSDAEKENVRWQEATWNEKLVEYMSESGFGSIYWCVNPESDDTKGLLLDDWSTFDTAKLALLGRLPSTDPLPILFPKSHADPLRKCLADEAHGVEVLYRKDGGLRYQTESQVYNMEHDDSTAPAAIVFPVDDEQVAGVVSCAAATGHQVCVRAGGMSYTGDSTCNGVLLDVRHLRELREVDGEHFWVGAGYTTGQLVTALDERGRIINVPYHGGVGMGWTLGCGQGFLSRELGLGCDQMVAARVVLEDGRVVEARDDNEHAELLWALRGAGGHFGVVVSVLLKTVSGVQPLPTCSDGFIRNPGFEEVLSDSVPAAWFNDNSPMEVVFDAAAPSGSRVLHLFDRAAKWHAPTTQIELSCLQPDVVYEITAMLKLPANVQCVQSGTTTRCVEFVLFVDRNGTSVGFSRGGRAGEWNKVSATFSLSEAELQATSIHGLWLSIEVPEIVDFYLDSVDISPLPFDQQPKGSMKPKVFSSFRLAWPRQNASQVVALWQDWAMDHPDSKFTCELMLWNHRQGFVELSGVYWGDVPALDGLLEYPLSVLGAPAQADRHNHTFAELASHLWGVFDTYLLRDPNVGWSGARRAFYNRAHLVKSRLDRWGIAKLVGLGLQDVPGAGPYDNYIQFKPMGARMANPPFPSAMQQRDGLAMVQYGGYWQTEEARMAMVSHQQRVYDGMEPYWGTGGFYPWKDNELENWEVSYWGCSAVHRLRDAKRAYDGEGVFITGQQSIDPNMRDKVTCPIPDTPLPRGAQANAVFSAVHGELSLNGHPFIVKGANWFGFETTRNMAFGLDVVAQDSVLGALVEHGVNTIRLPLAAKSILNSSNYSAPVWAADPQLNPHMELDDYLDGVEAFVSRAAQWGVFTLLDMHLLRNDKYPDPLPFDDEVPLRDVALAWERLAERFCGHWAVMGADLKNEPFDATWGDGLETDWQVAAEMLGETVAEACPHWLIFVEGITEWQSPLNALTRTGENAWASTLQPVAEHPISLPDMSKLVYSPHLYGPGTLGPNWMWEDNADGCLVCNYCKQLPPGLNCNDCTADYPGLQDALDPTCRDVLPLSSSPYPSNMPATWDLKFGFLTQQNYTVVVGEWGGTYANPALTELEAFDGLSENEKSEFRGLEATWNEVFVDYLAESKFGSIYWCVNPESDDTKGLLLDDWSSFDTAKLALLGRLPSTDPLPILFPKSHADPLRKCLNEQADGAEALYREEAGPRYQMESQVYNMEHDDSTAPAAIVFPVDDEQVAGVVSCAAATGHQVCVRAGGMSYTGDSTCNGVLMDVRHLRELREVDGEHFWVGAGYTTGQLVTALDERGRIINVPHHGGVGMGWTLGCGQGFLSRELGLGCDQMVAARVVLEDGRVVEARDDNEHAELLWALRGAGGHFGVVVSVLLKTVSGVEPLELPSCANAVVNPGFEAGTSFEGWANDGSEMEVVEDANLAPSGSRLLHVFGRSAKWHAPSTRLDISCLRPGLVYEVTFMLKLPQSAKCMQANTGVRCAEVLLRQGEDDNATSTLAGKSAGGVAGEWNQISTTFSLSEAELQAAAVAGLWLAIEVPEIVDFYLDSVDISPVPQDRQPQELVKPKVFSSFRLAWPRQNASQVVALWQDWAMDHPDSKFTCELMLWNHRQGFVELSGVYWGDVPALDGLLEYPLSVLGAPAQADRHNHTFAELASHLWGVFDTYLLRDPNVGWSGARRAFYNRAHLVKSRLDARGIAKLVSVAHAHVAGAGPYDNYIQFKPMGARMANPPFPSAMQQRDGLAMVQYGGYWQTEEARTAMVSHQQRVHGTMERWWGTGGFYPWKDNELENWETAYWGSSAAYRLRDAKCAYDGGDVFMAGHQSIKPDSECRAAA